MFAIAATFEFLDFVPVYNEWWDSRTFKFGFDSDSAESRIRTCEEKIFESESESEFCFCANSNSNPNLGPVKSSENIFKKIQSKLQSSFGHSPSPNSNANLKFKSEKSSDILKLIRIYMLLLYLIICTYLRVRFKSPPPGKKPIFMIRFDHFTKWNCWRANIVRCLKISPVNSPNQGAIFKASSIVILSEIPKFRSC